MDRDEMIKRINSGEKPLALSIEKWQDIVNGKGEDIADENCALCYVYRDYNRRSDDSECNGCPVMKASGKQCCRDTPWPDYYTATHVSRTSKKKAKLAAQAELKFLQSLVDDSISQKREESHE